jgi:Xaa-Pro aminopeptidase
VSQISLTKLPEGEYAERLSRVRAGMAERGADIGLAYANEFVPGDVQYLSGYDPQIEAVAAIVSPDGVALLGGPEGEAMFNDQGALGSWFNFELFEVPFQDYGSLRFATLDDVFAGLGVEKPESVLLLSDTKYVPHALVEHFAAYGTSIEPGQHILAECRYAKTPLELELFTEASRIATKATAAMIAALRPGMTELQLAALGDATVKGEGAYSYGWDTMVLSGPRINSIIGRSSNKRIGQGELVLVGACPRYAGYASTVGRTVVAGEATAEQTRFLAAGARALELAAQHLVAGGLASEVDRVPRAFLDDEGLGAFHAYGVGHGIGFSECLEWKTATRRSDYQLPHGISMSLDVGIFRNPAGFNGRFEDPYIIGHDGKTQRLTDLPVLMTDG